MPIVTITMYEGRTDEFKDALMDAVQRSVKKALRIEHDNFHHRILEYSRRTMRVPPAATDGYVGIDIQFLSRRTKEDKEELFRLLHDEFAALGIRDGDSIVVLSDPPPENWFIRGRTGTDILASVPKIVDLAGGPS